MALKMEQFRITSVDLAIAIPLMKDEKMAQNFIQLLRVSRFVMVFVTTTKKNLFFTDFQIDLS